MFPRRKNHTITMTILVTIICLVIGCAAWFSFKKVGTFYLAETENPMGLESGSLSGLLSLRLVLLLVLLVILSLGAVLVMEHLYFREHTQRLEAQINSDMLTGASSRRYGCQCLAEAFREFEETGVSGGIIVFDLDHLKAINDSFGHEVGDQVLRGVVDLAHQNIGPSDSVIRWGGDEFVVLLQDMQARDIKFIGQRLVEAVASAEFKVGNEVLKPSISLGGSHFSQGDKNYSAALNRADEALYQAKNLGKNRAHVQEFV